MTKQVKIKNELHAKIMRNCPKPKTLSEYLEGLLLEVEWLPKLKAILEGGTKRFEEAKKNPSRTVELFQAVDALVRGLEEFIAHVEERAK